MAPAEPAAAVHPVLPSRSMVGLATLTRSIGVRIPGGQPTALVAGLVAADGGVDQVGPGMDAAADGLCLFEALLA